MTASTQGVQLRSRAEWVSAAVKLLSPMRFDVPLLTVISTASVIEIVVKSRGPFLVLSTGLCIARNIPKIGARLACL